MSAEVINLLNDWECALPPRTCECGTLMLRAAPGQPCANCETEWRRIECETCGDTGQVRPCGHYADEMMGWRPCPDCGY